MFLASRIPTGNVETEDGAFKGLPLPLYLKLRAVEELACGD
jgi:hypothetical protein